ncbi:unnamed protein product, partial [Candidula unifasciata]
ALLADLQNTTAHISSNQNRQGEQQQRLPSHPQQQQQHSQWDQQQQHHWDQPPPQHQWDQHPQHQWDQHPQHQWDQHPQHQWDQHPQHQWDQHPQHQWDQPQPHKKHCLPILPYQPYQQSVADSESTNQLVSSNTYFSIEPEGLYALQQRVDHSPASEVPAYSDYSQDSQSQAAIKNGTGNFSDKGYSQTVVNVSRESYYSSSDNSRSSTPPPLPPPPSSDILDNIVFSKETE